MVRVGKRKKRAEAGQGSASCKTPIGAAVQKMLGGEAELNDE